jgi:hypothetical protein
MLIRFLRLARQNKFSAVAVAGLSLLIVMTVLSLWINPWPSNRRPPAVRIWIDIEHPSVRLTWARFARPEMGPTLIIHTSGSASERDAAWIAYNNELGVWHRRFQPSVFLENKIILVQRTSLIMQESGHFMVVGTEMQVEVSYWLVLGLVVAAQVPWLRKAWRDRRPRRHGFPVVHSP